MRWRHLLRRHCWRRPSAGPATGLPPPPLPPRRTGPVRPLCRNDAAHGRMLSKQRQQRPSYPGSGLAPDRAVRQPGWLAAPRRTCAQACARRAPSNHPGRRRDGSRAGPRGGRGAHNPGRSVSSGRRRGRPATKRAPPERVCRAAPRGGRGRGGLGGSHGIGRGGEGKRRGGHGEGYPPISAQGKWASEAAAERAGGGRGGRGGAPCGAPPCRPSQDDTAESPSSAADCGAAVPCHRHRPSSAAGAAVDGRPTRRGVTLLPSVARRCR